MAQIPAAISLLSALSGPFNPLQDMMTSGGDVQGFLLFFILQFNFPGFPFAPLLWQ